MTDIESTVVAALHEDADRPVRADGLLVGALARAQAIRRRRRLLGAAAGAGLVVAMVAGAVVGPGLVRGGPAVPPAIGVDPPIDSPAPSAPPPPPSKPTTLPGAVGAPGAIDSPAAVGTDARVIHFDLDLGSLDATTSKWTSAPGYEGVEITHGRTSRPWIEVFLARDAGRRDEFADGSRFFSSDHKPHEARPTPTTVAGRPAALIWYGWSAEDDPMGWILRWSPVDGLYAHILVFEDEPAVAFAAAAALRFEVAQRCAIPLRLDVAPADARLTGCRTALRREPIPTRGVWMHALLTFTTASGGRVEMWSEEDLPRAAIDTSEFAPNRTVAGRPAQWRSADPAGLWMPDFDPTGEVFISGAAEAEAIRIAGGLAVVGDLADPRTWPETPVG
jgi:hypothetical protein